MNIILLTPNDKISESIYVIADNRANHILKILKSTVGDTLEIGLLNEHIGKANIIEIKNHTVKLEILVLNKLEKTKTQIDIILALPRPQTLKKVLSTVATMGINTLFLIRSEKVEKSYFHSPLLEEKNYTKYLFEGLSQGKRVTIPKVIICKKFKEFFESNLFENKNTIKLLAHPNDKSFLNSRILKEQTKILIAIGPEGGWNDYEINYMVERGFQKFKLSQNILRVETAVSATLAQIELICNLSNQRFDLV